MNRKQHRQGAVASWKLVTTGLPVAAVAATAGTQALASSEVEIRQDSGLRKNAHYKKYLETARF